MQTNSRRSCVGKIKVNTVGTTSVFEVGDSTQLTPMNHTIAVQRERAVFIQREFDFPEYSLFTRPRFEPSIDESVRMTTVQACPQIVVKEISLFITSSSSITQIGSSEQLLAQSRIKHIRHLLREKPTS